MANLFFPLVDNDSNPLTGSKVTLRAVIPPYFTGSVYFPTGSYGGPTSTFSDDTGTAWFYNVIAGLYLVSYGAANANKPQYYTHYDATNLYINLSDSGSSDINGFTLRVTSTTNTNNPSIAYTQAASDARYIKHGDSVTSASYAGTASLLLGSIQSASFAVTASFALNGGGSGTTLTTGSTYPITSSWSNNARTASSLPDVTDINGLVGIDNTDPKFTLDVNGQIGNSQGLKTTYIDPGLGWLVDGDDQTSMRWDERFLVDAGGVGRVKWSGDAYTLVVNGTIGADSGTVSLIGTASYSPVEPAYSASISSIKQNTLVTGNNYLITASWSNNALTASIANNLSITPSTSSFAITASKALSVTSASYAGTASVLLGSITSASYALSASYAPGNPSISASYAGTASVLLGSVISASYAATTSVALATTAISASYASQSAFAPVIFSNVQIINGELLILSSDTNTWYALGVTDDGEGSFTTNLTPTVNTGSYYASGSFYAISSSVQVTSSISSSWASASLSSSYTLTASYALNGGSGGASLVTGSTYPITASWAQTASVLIGSVVSASYSATIASNQPYTLIQTSSLNWITASMQSANQQVNLTNASAYHLTHSNVPPTGSTADVLLYISHSASTTSSISFPSTWQNIGFGWPTVIPANTIGVLWLRAIDANVVLGTLSFSGSAISFPIVSASYASSSLSSSYALTASYALNGGSGGASLTTGSTYPITSSWSLHNVSSSYLSGSTGNVSIGGNLTNLSSSGDYNLLDLTSDGTCYLQVGRNDQSGTEAILTLSDAFTHKYSARTSSFFQVSLDAATTIFDIDSKGAGASTEITIVGYVAPTLYLNEVVDGGSTNNVNIKVDGANGINGDPTNRKGRSLIISAESNVNGGVGGNVTLVAGTGDSGQESGSIILSGSNVITPDILSTDGQHDILGFRKIQFDGGYIGNQDSGADPIDLNNDGSARFANGAMTVDASGNIIAASITGSLNGTASYATKAISASYAGTASVLLGSITSASYASSASFSLTASYVTASNVKGNVSTASYAVTAGTVLGSVQSASYVSGSNAVIVNLSASNLLSLGGTPMMSFTDGADILVDIGANLVTSTLLVDAFDARSVSQIATGTDIDSTAAITASSGFKGNLFGIATTASFVASNQVYTVIPTSSLQWITMSMQLASQQVNLTTANAYHLTHSNVPPSGSVADILLYISHSAATTSSLSFPSTWQNIGMGWPTSLAANTIGVLWLRAIDANKVIGTFNTSGSVIAVATASYASSSFDGSKAWAKYNITGSSITTTQLYNVGAITRISAGIHGVTFVTPMTTGFYNVNFNGFTGSASAPTASIACIVNQATTGFTMSICTGTSLIVNADPLIAGFTVFGF